MRALAAFLLVVLAAGGLYLLLGGESDRPPVREMDDPVLEPDPPSAVAEPGTPADMLTPNERDVAEVVPLDVDRSAAFGAQPGQWENAVGGSVLSPNGRGMEGVEVRLERRKPGQGLLAIIGGGDGEVELSYKQTTDAQGGFRFPGVEPGTNYHLRALHADHTPVSNGPLTVAPTGESYLDLRFVAGARLEGFVRDEFGRSIPGAAVTLHQGPSLPGVTIPAGARSTVASDAGKYVFTNVAGAGNRTLLVGAKGFGNVTKTVHIKPGQGRSTLQQDVVLKEAESIRGRVVDPNGEGIAGARIDAFMYESAEGASRGSAVTDRDGAFDLDDLTAGAYVLVIRARGWGEQRATNQVTGGPPLQIRLKALSSIRGVAVDSNGQKPLTDFRALARAQSRQGKLGASASEQDVRRTPEGTFDLRGLEPGTYLVQIVAEGYAPSLSKPITLGASEVVEDVRIVLDQGGSITGVVRNSRGEPIPGAVVRTNEDNWRESPLTVALAVNAPENATRRRQQTDAQGRFRLERLAPESYQVEVTHPDYTSFVRNSLKVEPGVPVELGPIVLADGATVSGVAFLNGNTPVARAKVSATSQDDKSMSFHAMADQNGAFRFTNLPAGRYEFSASESERDDGNVFGIIEQIRSSAVQVVVRDGDKLTQNMFLRR